MEGIQIYSEKLGSFIVIENVSNDDDHSAAFDDSSLVGWSHNGWNNDNGGGSW